MAFWRAFLGYILFNNLKINLDEDTEKMYLLDIQTVNAYKLEGPERQDDKRGPKHMESAA